jgi:hypothetical protein
MLSDEEPAHPILSALGFGCSIAAAAWLLLPGLGLQRDPLQLVLIAATGTVAGRMLVYALSGRVLAAATSLLVLACHAAIRVRVEQGTWSGLPAPLVPVTVLAMMAWVPSSRDRSPRRWSACQPRTRVLPAPAPTRPMQVTGLLAGRWAVLGGQPLPAADRGGQSRVHLALDTWHGGRKAVAKLPSQADPARGAACLASEAELLRACRASPHVVELLDGGHDLASGSFFVILAHHRRGSLARYLAATSGFPLGLALAIGEDLLRGVVDLHEHCGRPIAHGDLNPRNLLLREGRVGTGRPAVVICDLGMARRVPGGAVDDEVPGTARCYSPWYGAPELLRAAAWGLEADVYGAASVLYELVTGQPPLKRESAWLGRSFTTLVRDGEQPASAGSLHPGLPGGLVELLDGCLATRPEDRPGSAREVLTWLRHAGRGSEDVPVPFSSLRRYDGRTGIQSA